jgi:hypothetical protein
MKLLITLVALAAAAFAVYWRKNPNAANSVWTQATDTTTSVAGAAAEKVAKAADKAKGAASTATGDTEAAGAN